MLHQLPFRNRRCWALIVACVAIVFNLLYFFFGKHTGIERNVHILMNFAIIPIGYCLGRFVLFLLRKGEFLTETFVKTVIIVVGLSYLMWVLSYLITLNNNSEPYTFFANTGMILAALHKLRVCAPPD